MQGLQRHCRQPPHRASPLYSQTRGRARRDRARQSGPGRRVGCEATGAAHLALAGLLLAALAGARVAQRVELRDQADRAPLAGLQDDRAALLQRGALARRLLLRLAAEGQRGLRRLGLGLPWGACCLGLLRKGSAACAAAPLQASPTGLTQQQHGTQWNARECSGAPYNKPHMTAAACMHLERPDGGSSSRSAARRQQLGSRGSPSTQRSCEASAAQVTAAARPKALPQRRHGACTRPDSAHSARAASARSAAGAATPGARPAAPGRGTPAHGVQGGAGAWRAPAARTGSSAG